MNSLWPFPLGAPFPTLFSLIVAPNANGKIVCIRENGEHQSYLDLSVDTPIVAKGNTSAPEKGNPFNIHNADCACSVLRLLMPMYLRSILPVRRYSRRSPFEMWATVAPDSLTTIPLSIANWPKCRVDSAIDCPIHPTRVTRCSRPARLATASIYCHANWAPPTIYNCQFRSVSSLIHFYLHLSYSISPCDQSTTVIYTGNSPLGSILADFRTCEQKSKKKTSVWKNTFSTGERECGLSVSLTCLSNHSLIPNDSDLISKLSNVAISICHPVMFSIHFAINVNRLNSPNHWFRSAILLTCWNGKKKRERKRIL